MRAAARKKVDTPRVLRYIWKRCDRIASVEEVCTERHKTPKMLAVMSRKKRNRVLREVAAGKGDAGRC